MPHAEDPRLTVKQAYEAAFRYVRQYQEREPHDEALEMMIHHMRPFGDGAPWPEHAGDPASWNDFLNCVQETLDGAPLPTL